MELIRTKGATPVLGYNQKQGGSELQSGARALLIPSELTNALCSMKGRIAARTMMLMSASQGLLNYAAFRPYAMMEVIRRNLPAHVTKPLLVDPAAGFSPEFIWLAREMPHAEFIEIDTPEIIQDKKRRLKNIQLPPNFRFIEADLDAIPLHEALGGRRVDAMLAIGAYVPAPEFIELLDYLDGVLSEEGIVIAAFPFAPGIEDLARTNTLFRRLAGEPVGIVEGEEDVRIIFEQAHYQHVNIYRFSELAKDLGKAVPANIEIVAAASRK